MKLPKDPTEITKLFNSSNKEDKELGYKAFLNRTHWYQAADPENLKLIACKQLAISPNKVFESKIKRIEPGLLWASQNGLEADKLNMVEAAYKYFKQKGEDFPPIIVWDFFDNQKIKKVVHDGHHRTYFSYRLNIKLRAVILEPLGNYNEVQHKFRYTFQISLRVTDLPVMVSHFSQKKKKQDNIGKKQEIEGRTKSPLQDKRAKKQDKNDEIKENTLKDLHVLEINKGEEKVCIYPPEKTAIPAKVKNKRFQFSWNYLNPEDFGSEELKHYDIQDLKKMFKRTSHPMVPELAYMSFLLHSRWGLEFDLERGVERTLMQLRLPLFEGEGLTHQYRKINPDKIWASQDSLDEDLLEMVEEAWIYMEKENKPISPVIVWLIKNSSRYNYVCHDGHHRIYIAHKLKTTVPALILEYWIDNRDNPLLRKKIPFERVDKYVIELPIEKFKGIRYTMRMEKRNLKVKKIDPSYKCN